MRRSILASLALATTAGGLVTALVLAPSGTVLPGGLPSPTPGAVPTRVPVFQAISERAPVPTAEGVSSTLQSALSDPALGELSVSVIDVASGASLLSDNDRRAVTPASTAKIVTAIAALRVLGPDKRFETKVVAGRGDAVVLVGGGDPSLAGEYARKGVQAAQLADLARQLGDREVSRVVVDDSLFSGPSTGPGWKRTYVEKGDVAPVTALAVDGGRTSSGVGRARSADPARAAGRAFAQLLDVESVRSGTAPEKSQVLARVYSPPVSVLVERMLQDSDNDLAEALGRHVALALGRPGSFSGESRALRAAVAPLLRAAGMSSRAVDLQDASGLSRDSLITPAALTRLLAVAVSNPDYRSVLTGLPVAGFDGTLARRYRVPSDTTGAGVVRAKTGTLSGVSALAGIVVTREGRLLAFAVVANDIGASARAQRAIDRLAGALATCGCR